MTRARCKHCGQWIASNEWLGWVHERSGHVYCHTPEARAATPPQTIGISAGSGEEEG